jgi:hypothetical protein
MMNLELIGDVDLYVWFGDHDYGLDDNFQIEGGENEILGSDFDDMVVETLLAAIETLANDGPLPQVANYVFENVEVNLREEPSDYGTWIEVPVVEFTGLRVEVRCVNCGVAGEPLDGYGQCDDCYLDALETMHYHASDILGVN